MTRSAPADAGPRRPAASDLVVYLLGVAGLAAAITWVWLGMRSVMDIGGACASGGPYQIAVPCPPGVDLVMVLAFPLGFLSVGVIVWKGARLGGPWIGVAALAWPALFLSLGWNFLEYAFSSPGGGVEWGWLIPGVIFLLMGGIPLLAWIGTRGESAIVPPVAGTRAGRDVRQLRDLRDAMDRAYRDAYRRAGSRAMAASMTLADATDPVTPPDPTVDEDLVDGLERLAGLHRDGALSDGQFEAAKDALIAAAQALGERHG